MTTCGVCCERFNKTNHKKVCCPFCDFESCRECCQTYLLSTSEEPHCMSCKNEHNREFIDTFCTKRFRNVDYKKRREQLLFERELIRLPETQPYVQRILKRRELYRLRQEISDMYVKARRRYHYTVETGGKWVDHYLTMCIFAEQSFKYINDRINELRNVPLDDAEQSVKFTRGCPHPECRGFLDELWKCGICSRSFCEQCNEECNDGHVCDPQLVKTMKLINRDTKPCPKCSTMIHKIDGCAQMWCTTCQTAFDWRTGNVEKGRIHNPHYFEFKSKSREHGDIPCGGRPVYRELLENNAPPRILQLNHVVGTAEYQLVYKYGFTYDSNLSLRVEYLMNAISEDQLKRELQRRDKYNSKVRDIQHIYQMFVDTGGDLLRQWMIDPQKEDEILETAVHLSKYTNEIITNIRQRYNCIVPRYIFI